MAIPLVYNLRNVMQRPVSTLTTAIGVGLTVAIFIGALALAAGFQAALVETGSPDNALVLRKGADSEISSGISLDAGEHPPRAPRRGASGPDGRPLRERRDGGASPTSRGSARRARRTSRCAASDPDAADAARQVKIVGGPHVHARHRRGDRRPRASRPRSPTAASATSCAFEQRDFTVVGHFTAGGSAFESEIWGDDAVLMPALDREGAFQSVDVPHEGPGAVRAHQEGARGRPAAPGPGEARARVLRRASRELLATRDHASSASFITADHGGRRDVRRHEHDVRDGRRAHPRDRHAAGAGLHARSRSCCRSCSSRCCWR